MNQSRLHCCNLWGLPIDELGGCGIGGKRRSRSVRVDVQAGRGSVEDQLDHGGQGHLS